MTTATPRATVLAEYKRATETITAEHHPSDDGMKYAVLIIGGKHHGIEIHCATEESAIRLYAGIVVCRQFNLDHPYLQAV